MLYIYIYLSKLVRIYIYTFTLIYTHIIAATVHVHMSIANNNIQLGFLNGFLLHPNQWSPKFVSKYNCALDDFAASREGDNGSISRIHQFVHVVLQITSDELVLMPGSIEFLKAPLNVQELVLVRRQLGSVASFHRISPWGTYACMPIYSYGGILE